jgi:glycosyltransferase involved in cell wall biosynthesis
VVFSGARWVATGGGQRPVQLARQWAATGRQVLFISNRGQQFGVHEGVICGNFVDHLPLWLPQLAQWQSGTMFCGMPAYHSHLGGRMNHWRMVLDICDDWEEFVRIGALEPDNWEPEAVSNAFAHADLVTHSAACLESFCKRYGARRTLLVPNGGPEAPVPQQRTDELVRGAGLNVVFCGALWGRWVDWPSLQQMARELAETDPGAVVHVIGGFDNAGNPPERPLEPNMRCYGERIWPYALQMMANCDVAVIPFRNHQLCKAVDPNKWYDYIAAGLPVVATDVMDELRGRPYTLVCKPEELAQAVRLAGQQGRIPEAEVQRIVGETSWRVRAEAVMRGLAAVPNTRLARRAWRDMPREAAS